MRAPRRNGYSFLVYVVVMLVTVFLSNVPTAIGLTPAVYAATRAAGANPLPYLLGEARSRPFYPLKSPVWACSSSGFSQRRTILSPVG